MTSRLRLALLLVVAVWAHAVAQPYDFRLPYLGESSRRTVIAPGSPCDNCGRVVSVRETATAASSSSSRLQAAGRDASASDRNLVVGAVVYLPFSENSSDKPFVGGVGTPEMNERFGQNTYLVEVRMDDGSLRYLSRRDGAQFSVGDRVRALRDGRLELVTD